MIRCGETYFNFSPCPWMSPQKGTKLVAIIGGVIDVLLFIWAIYNIVGIFGSEDRSDNPSLAISLSVTILLGITLKILLAFFLHYGAIKGSEQICSAWLSSTLMLVVIDCIACTVYLSWIFQVYILVGALIIVLFRLYQMLVAYTFVQLLQFEIECRL